MQMLKQMLQNFMFLESSITCQGYGWNQHTHQGGALWIIPPASRNSQENFLWLRDAWKTIWSIWHYLILRKAKERRKGTLFNKRYSVLHKKREVHSAVVKMKRNTYLLIMKAFKQTMSLPRLAARVKRMMMRKGMRLISQWQLLDLGGGLLAICFKYFGEFYCKMYWNYFCGWGRVILSHVQTRRGAHYVVQWQEQAHGKLCIGKLKCTNVTIAFFSSPSFFLFNLSFSSFLYLRWCDFGAYWAQKGCQLKPFHPMTANFVRLVFKKIG